MLNLRAKAAQLLEHVIVKQQSLDPQFCKLEQYSSQDQSLIKNICYGVLRNYFLYQTIIDNLVKKIKPKDHIVKTLLMVGLYQLQLTRIPNYAAVSETVSACKQLKKPFFTGLVNKVLKRASAELDLLINQAQQNIEAKYNHPIWLVELIKQDYPKQWQAILTANNQPPPLWLCINQQQIAAELFCQQLEQQQIDYQFEPPYAIRIIDPVAVETLPGYGEGYFWVQDLAGQQLANFITLKPGMRVLDACAAPGSKTALMLAIEPRINLTALDISAPRLERLKENIERLKLPQPTIKAANACEPDRWWDKQPFDLILIDAPCSGTGVIRRHPDIKLLRHPQDIPQLAQTQRDLITQLSKTLTASGQMIYSTCSILSAENSQLIQRLPTELSSTKAEQLLPQANKSDGFFYNLLTV